MKIKKNINDVERKSDMYTYLNSILEKNNFKSRHEKHKIITILEKGLFEENDLKNLKLEKSDVKILSNYFENILLYENINLDNENIFNKLRNCLINLDVRHFDEKNIKSLEDQILEKVVLKCNDDCDVILFATTNKNKEKEYTINIIGDS